MGNRHRSSVFNLISEQRDYAAVTTQHITKANRHELCFPGLTAEHLDDHLTNSFGSPHDICGIDRLIGRNKHKGFHLMSFCRSCHVISAKNIVLNRLIGAVLHKRHMLVCCRMVDHLGPAPLKNLFHSYLVANRSNQYQQVQFRVVALQFLLNTVCIVLVNIKNNQLRRVSGGNLAAPPPVTRTRFPSMY